MDPNEFQAGQTMRQLFGGAAPPPTSAAPDQSELSARFQALEDRVRLLEAAALARTSTDPAPPPALIEAAPPPAPVSPEVSVDSQFDVPADIQQLLAEHPVIPEPDMTEDAFRAKLMSDHPGLSFDDWVRIAPYLILAIPNFSMENLKGWPSYQRVNDALQTVQRRTTDESSFDSNLAGGDALATTT
jgi:hypothetical protein